MCVCHSVGVDNPSGRGGGDRFAEEAHRLLPAARAVADPSRLRIMLLLAERDATVSDLASTLQLPQPRVSGHLRLLTDAGLVQSARRGRWRYYALRADRTELLLAGLHSAADTAPTHDEPGAGLATDDPERRARRCYDHLAGAAGVQLLDALLRRGWLIPGPNQPQTQPRYTLTESGTQALAERDTDLNQATTTRRVFAYGCADWTERRPHLGGALGHEITATLERAGIITVPRDTRAVTVHAPLTTWLDTDRRHPHPDRVS